jgi:hypothetical protein
LRNDATRSACQAERAGRTMRAAGNGMNDGRKTRIDSSN